MGAASMEFANNYALRRADELIRSGKSEFALPILIEYLRKNPRSEQGWLLLSLTIPERVRQIDSLRMVLKINPNNSIARSRLAQLKLEAGSPSAQAPSAPEPVSVEGQPKAQAPVPMKGQESGPPPEYSEFQAAYNNFDAPLNGSGSAFKTRADPRQPFKELTSEPALIGRTSSPILSG